MNEWDTGSPIATDKNMCGIRLRRLLARPIRNVVVLMPPFCITSTQLDQAIDAIARAIVDVCGPIG